MNMIYAALLCYANGNCIVPNGDPAFTYFNTLAACERQVQVENLGHLRNTNMKAYCFEKPGWQPVYSSTLPPVKSCYLPPEYCHIVEPEPANEMELDGQ
jgi:hypothetical protein